MSSTSVTHGSAPDFTVRYYGADTLWFALAARREGRWHFVPFDDQSGARDRTTFAVGATHGLIEGEYDPCGCAGGPTTYAWYRFAATGVFEPTVPPGPHTDCSAATLGRAGHWPAVDADALTRRAARPFHVVRVACADGWAVAADGRHIAVYEDTGHRWLRIGVGTPRQVGEVAEFALSRSVLERLARAVGVRLAPLKRSPQTSWASPRPARLRATVLVTFGPGDRYDLPYSSSRRPKALAVRVVHGAHSRVTRFRWRNGRWIRLPARP